MNDGGSEISDNEDNDPDYESEDNISGNKSVLLKMWWLKLSKQRYNLLFCLRL